MGRRLVGGLDHEMRLRESRGEADYVVPSVSLPDIRTSTPSHLTCPWDSQRDEMKIVIHPRKSLAWCAASCYDTCLAVLYHPERVENTTLIFSQTQLHFVQRIDTDGLIDLRTRPVRSK